ncbi:MAG TPA: ABC transporter substrate-binding protein [Hyphomicrobium sp.]|nr:ABC transporter substrate-binding protein [Hyphomicrobium sp.]
MASPTACSAARSYSWKAAFSSLLAGCTLVAYPAFAENAAPQTPPAAETPAPTTQSSTTDANKRKITISILYVKQDRQDEELPLSMLDLPSADDGIAGAKLGIADDNTTGRFLNQAFKLDVLNGNVDDLIKGATEKVGAGDNFIIADMEPDALLKFSDALKDKHALIFNVGNPDDRLREEDCRANVLHIAPTRSMLTDALAQYLVWKQWRNWLLVYGPTPEDKLLADSYRRSAKKFGGKIVQELEFKQDTGSRRADGGYEQVQQQIPSFLQNAKDHDVIIIADEKHLFADYFPFRTWIPRPIAGSAGLTASSWHPALEFWGGTQFQHRFRKLNSRMMRNIDYDAWVATRTVGEAATRKHSGDFETLRTFIKSPSFEVAAFKGVATSFRSWNGQLREPLIIGTPKLPVSVSPQAGFLHQTSVLDTLGYDKPETKCKAYTQ